MVQRFILLFIFLFLSVPLYLYPQLSARLAPTDSLERALTQKQLPDSQRVEIMNELAFLLRNTQVEKAAAYAYRATQLARKIGFAKGLARSLGYEGMMAYRQGKYDFAVSYHLESLSIATSIADSVLMAYRYNDLSNVYADMGELDRALEHTLRSLHIKEKINDLEGVATSWRNLGIIHLRKKQYPEALLHLEQAKRLATEIGDTRILAYTCIYLGEWHGQQQKPLQALGFLQDALRLHQQINNQYGLAEAYNSSGEVYLYLSRAGQALEYFQQAQKTAQAIGIKLEIQRAYLGMARSYEALNNWQEAYKYYEQYTAVKDVILTEKNLNRIAFLEAQFQNKLKENQIGLLTQERALQKKEIEKERLSRQILALLGAFVLILLLIVSFGWQQKKKNNALLQKQNEEIKLQKEQLALQAEALQQSHRIKDRLFSIVAHDLRGPMASLKGAIDLFSPEVLNSEELEEIKNSLKHRFAVTDETLQNLLHWARNQMEQEHIQGKALRLQHMVNRKIELFAEVAQNKQISLCNMIAPEVYVYADENHLYTILQNLIANAIKFSYEGGKIIISSEQNQGRVRIAVQDTGKGISAQQKSSLFNEKHFSLIGTAGEAGHGLGLYLVKTLTEQNQGSVWVESEEGQGSTFYIELPVQPYGQLSLEKV